MENWSKSFPMLSVAMVVSLLAGCSTGGSSAGQPASPSVAPSPAASNPQLGQPVSITGNFEIQYFVGGYGDAWWKEAIKDFKAKYPAVTVIEQAGPSVNDQMKTRWISNNPPDLVYIDGAGSSETQMVKDGQLLELTDWMKTTKLADGASMTDSFIVPANKYNDGKIYSLPLLFDTRGTWYDKAWFEKEGFKVPTDYPSWLSSMKAIKERSGISPLATTGVFPSVFIKGVLYPAFGAQGGDEFLAALIDGKEGAWSNEKTLNVMKKIEEIQKAGLVDPGFAALTHTQAQMNFLLHKNAYVPVGFWLPNEMKKDIPSDFKFGIIPTPMNDPGKPMVVIPDIRTIAIAKNAKNPEAAKAFIQMVFQKNYAAKFSELTGAMMNIKGVDLNSNPNVAVHLKEANALINDPSKVVLNYIPHPLSVDLEKPIGDALVSLLLGKIDAEEFVKKAEAAAKAYRGK
jgi:N-acetylglucosamine transport system substrate-binding protein